MIGAWLFLLGLVIAIVGGFMSYSWMPWILGVIGIVVGLVNIGDKEVNHFLVAAVAFLLSVTSLSAVFTPYIPQVGTILSLFGVMIAPAAAIVALKAIYDFAKEQ
ncbi:hypothetical protein H0O03_02645 [Candidatus Micrarchaeota archaeon]|nr:hypothetical protein [Candidatus Micrarchaeota archaeon]